MASNLARIRAAADRSQYLQDRGRLFKGGGRMAFNAHPNQFWQQRMDNEWGLEYNFGRPVFPHGPAGVRWHGTRDLQRIKKNMKNPNRLKELRKARRRPLREQFAARVHPNGYDTQYRLAHGDNYIDSRAEKIKAMASPPKRGYLKRGGGYQAHDASVRCNPLTSVSHPTTGKCILRSSPDADSLTTNINMISQNRFPVRFAYTLNKQQYDVRSLREYLNRGGTKVPHSRATISKTDADAIRELAKKLNKRAAQKKRSIQSHPLR